MPKKTRISPGFTINEVSDAELMEASSTYTEATAKAIPIERRRELIEHEVTLDGRRAVICGVKNDFATVAELPNGARVDFAWTTVERVVMEGNGDFKS